MNTNRIKNKKTTKSPCAITIAGERLRAIYAHISLSVFHLFRLWLFCIFARCCYDDEWRGRQLNIFFFVLFCFGFGPFFVSSRTFLSLTWAKKPMQIHIGISSAPQMRTCSFAYSLDDENDGDDLSNPNSIWPNSYKVECWANGAMYINIVINGSRYDESELRTDDSSQNQRANERERLFVRTSECGG